MYKTCCFTQFGINFKLFHSKVKSSENMLNFYPIILFSCIIGAVYGRSEADIKASFMKLGMECNNEFPVSAEEIQALQEHKIPETENARCLLACVYRKMSWLDDQGNFDLQSANDHSEKEHPDDPSKLEGSKKLFDFCKKVNDENVSDGTKGCERASHLTKCLTENATKYGFQI